VSQVLAVAGKGGTGKTTLAALLIRALSRESGPVLAVDADPNSNLPESLGLRPERTIGGVLEEFMGSTLTIPQGMPKQAYLELRLNQTVSEAKGLDLVVMGRAEGEGCYCAPNAVLRDFLEKLSDNYSWVVIDNEAGMEHLSRRTASRIDVLILVSDPTVKGIRTVKNLLALVEELKLGIRQKYLVINRAESPDPRLNSIVESLPITFLGCIPEDQSILSADLEEKPLFELTEDSPAVEAVKKILARIKQGEKSLSLEETSQVIMEGR
jgi:CO dehydrogenase maturation factor